MPCTNFTPQSGTAEGTVGVAPAEMQECSVSFVDRTMPYTYEVASVADPTRTAQDQEDSPLGDFFKRPVKLAEYEWGTGTTLAENFNPWAAFFAQERVINRLANFKLLRASLRLRVLVNGNSFQYGRSIMYYRPMTAFDALSTDSALIPQDLVSGSQCPHVYIDPTTSQGGELLLPFFWHKNYFSIPDAEWADAGTIFLRSLNSLKHANGATDRVTITILGWCEDVHVSVLTSVNPVAIVPQMGELEEANSRGIISGPATMMSKVAGALASIPMIRPYALASQAVADTVSKVARMFGYCKPAITKAPEPYRPTPTSTLALTNVPDLSQKLTVDHKQELTIDPRISGIESSDPMNILAIAQRESYLTSFTWAVGTAPDTLLWNSRVQPALWAESGATPAYHMTPMCVACLPFSRWKGSIKYRFQIVSSNFHRGRLRFIWDPQFIVDPTNNFNVVNSMIVDISEEKDFTLEIANGQEYTFLNHLGPGETSVTNAYSTTAYTSLDRRADIPLHNGILGVYVLNELTVPNSTTNNDIAINVFVSAGKDFEVAAPTDYFQRFSIQPQVGMVDDTQEDTSEPSKPIQDQTKQMHGVSQEEDKANMVFMGEAIASFRPLLKRFNLHTSRGPLASGNRIIGGTLPAFPYHRGAVAGAINVTGAGDAYNYCNTVLLHWVTLPFAGWRGSTRWKFLPRGNVDGSQPITMYISRREPDTSIYYDEAVVDQSNYTGPSSVARAGAIDFPYALGDIQRMPSCTLGAAYSSSLVNPTIEAEIPFYSSNRFVPGKPVNYTTETTLPFKGMAFQYRIVMNGEPSSVVDLLVAAGDDFQTYFWTGMPRLYYTPVNPS